MNRGSPDATMFPLEKTRVGNRRRQLLNRGHSHIIPVPVLNNTNRKVIWVYTTTIIYLGHGYTTQVSKDRRPPIHRPLNVGTRNKYVIPWLRSKRHAGARDCGGQMKSGPGGETPKTYIRRAFW